MTVVFDYHTSFVAGDDVAADPSKARSVLRFGPIAETAMTTQIAMVVSERHDGSASRDLNYNARTGNAWFGLGVDPEQLDRGPFEIGVDILGTVSLEEAGVHWEAESGTIELRSDADEVVIELRGIDMRALNEPSSPRVDLEGRVRGEPVWACTRLVPAGPTAPRNPDGTSPPQSELDPDWASPFCSVQREAR